MRALAGRAGWAFGTALGVGLFPVAPATAASLAAVVVYWLSPLAGDSVAYYLLAALSIPVGVWATGSLVREDDPDPHKAVWDEVAGMWLTCLLLPKTLPWLAAAFVCFRVLDVLKPWPIRRFERLPSGLGIMADDVAAGTAGAIALNLVHRLAF